MGQKAMTRFLLQVAVLLSAVGPVAGFAQSDNEPPLYIINYFEIGGSVEVSTEDYTDTPYLVQSEHMSERYCQVKKPKLVESVDEHLQTPQIPARYHFLCCLAVLSLQSQPPRY